MLKFSTGTHRNGVLTNLIIIFSPKKNQRQKYHDEQNDIAI